MRQTGGGVWRFARARMNIRRYAPRLLAASSALLLLHLVLSGPAAGEETGARGAAPSAGDAAPPPSAEASPDLGEMSYDAARGRYVAPMGDARAVLTILPGLQARLERVLASYRVPWGATVLVEPGTGRILALAEHSQKEPGARDLALRAFAPAASIFKIVTSAALLERGIE